MVRASTNHALYVFSYFRHGTESEFLYCTACNQECLLCLARAIFSGKRPTLLRFAKQTADPKLAAGLLDKAAELNDKVEDVSLQNMDVRAQAPDVERQT